MRIAVDELNAFPFAWLIRRLSVGETLEFSQVPSGALSFTVVREGKLVVMRDATGAEMARGLSFAEVWQDRPRLHGRGHRASAPRSA